MTSFERTSCVLDAIPCVVRTRVPPAIPRTQDGNGDGAVSFEEFRRGLNEVGVTLAPEQFQGLLQACDVDGGGTVTVAEVVQTLYPDTEQAADSRQGY